MPDADTVIRSCVNTSLHPLISEGARHPRSSSLLFDRSLLGSILLLQLQCGFQHPHIN